MLLLRHRDKEKFHFACLRVEHAEHFSSNTAWCDANLAMTVMLKQLKQKQFWSQKSALKRSRNWKKYFALVKLVNHRLSAWFWQEYTAIPYTLFLNVSFASLLLGITSILRDGTWAKLNAHHLGTWICSLQINICFCLFFIHYLDWDPQPHACLLHTLPVQLFFSEMLLEFFSNCSSTRCREISWISH